MSKPQAIGRASRPQQIASRSRSHSWDRHHYEEDDFTPIKPDDNSTSLLWAVLSSYLPTDEKSIQRLFVQRAEYDLSLTHNQLKSNKRDQFMAYALCVRDRLIERWKDTELFFDKTGVKKVYYLSLEFLLGRSLQNAIDNLNLRESYARSLRNLGIDMESLFDQETDAGLGNGGLGRLAACFLDSLATMNYPAWGYGLRYQYGMFHQMIKDGYQCEVPDFWLRYGHPWEIERFDIQFPVHFYGKVTETPNPNPSDDESDVLYSWEGSEVVMACAYDVPIPGYDTFNTINLRLWSSKPSLEFDFHLFDKGDYFRAVENKQKSEAITSLLYPNDNSSAGKELRLKQQYFFVCATLQDILKRFNTTGKPIEELHTMVGIQLNDTHPSIGITEMMRVLVDNMKIPWKKSWTITQSCFAYTNHTVLPEALEKWDVDLVGRLLPRHLSIIFKINHYFLNEVALFFAHDQTNIDEIKRKMSLIEEGHTRCVRMAHLAMIGTHHTNGVAAIHSKLLTTTMFPEFYRMYPNRFLNVTNGITPRRWLHQSNKELSALITETLGSNDWLTHFEKVAGLKKHVDDKSFLKKWHQVKQNSKQKLADFFRSELGISVSTKALFDIQIKRIHEYKRQFLNILSVIWRWRRIRGMSDEERAEVLPRVVIFGGKAAPGYYTAKLIIKLINLVANYINEDPAMEGLLKVVFVPNYNVSLAELMIPASDLSQHISTAGTEASGTSNMKFAINGGLIIGTMDGANIEIREEIGAENMFIFGVDAHTVPAKRDLVRSGGFVFPSSLLEVIQIIKSGTFGNFPEYQQLLDSIVHNNDHYLVSVDWESYIQVNDQIDQVYQDQDRWLRMSVMSTAGMGKFSSDRTIHDYATKIWGLQPCPRPGPVLVDTHALSLKVPHVHRNASSLDGSFSPAIALERLTEQDQVTISSFSPSLSNQRRLPGGW